MKTVQIPDPFAVAFAPDWTQGNPYQLHLQQALRDEQVLVSYIRSQRRGFPLSTSAKRLGVRLVHLHWPEAFFDMSGRRGEAWLRKPCYWIDFHRMSSFCPVVLTAHNLYPHDRRHEPLVRRLIRMTYTQARAIIAHSAAGAVMIQREFGVDRDKVHVIPHGSLNGTSPPLMQLSFSEARAKLGIKEGEAFCLMFGVIAKYKGIEEVIRFWKTHTPDCHLRIIGTPSTPEYGRVLEKLVDNHPRIHLQPKWLTDDEITTWLRATNCVLFNYSHILTSGAAIQARALGVPILLPHRLRTVDLDEPHPLVTRFWKFDLDFDSALQAALASRTDYSRAEAFRKQNSWANVARATAKLYRSLLEN
jgi:glycosyltransferase involved in cell wall biosynthesis